MSLLEKIQASTRLIKEVTSTYTRPVVYSSFGKDSMILLNLVKKCGLKLPVIFHREAFFPKKYAFANAVIEAEEFEVYDYPPLMMGVVKNAGTLEIINRHQCGEVLNYLPIGIREPEEGKSFLCGYLDLYSKPVGNFLFPWDVVLVGHKSSDVDPVVGPVPLGVSLQVNSHCPDFAFPLKDFTDEDIWEYHKLFNVPINRLRYDESNGWKEFPDITYNPDYFHACIACLDPDGPDEVWCPKGQKMIPHQRDHINYLPPTPPPYVTQEAK